LPENGIHTPTKVGGLLPIFFVMAPAANAGATHGMPVPEPVGNDVSNNELKDMIKELIQDLESDFL